MPPQTFFSYHHGRDAWRAGQVRNSSVTKSKNKRGYLDKAEWEEVKKKGRPAVKHWIDSQLKGTSVTVVLIGKETCDREYVKYEIRESFNRGNTIIGVRIHNLKNQDGETDSPGENPFDKCTVKYNGKERPVSEAYKNLQIYDWVEDDGYNNFDEWIATAIDKGR